MDKVKLYHPIIGMQELDKEHAERLMLREFNGGWSLKPIVKQKAPAAVGASVDQVLTKTQDADNGITDTGSVKEPSEGGDNTEGDKA